MMKKQKLLYGILVIAVIAIVGIGSLYMYISRPITRDMEAIKDVKARYVSSLMNIPGVNGVGIGECNRILCLKVFLEKETPESKSIPKQLEGFKVDVEIIGPINAGPARRLDGEYKYLKSGYDECDFPSKESCKQNNCIWRLTTDAIVPSEPIPATCCPADKIPTFENNDPTDICMILHG